MFIGKQDGCCQDKHYGKVPGVGGGTHILGHGREVPQWWPPFFDPIRSIFYTSTQSDWPPLSAEKKIGLSLSHLVPEILGPKFGLIFHQNVLFNRF